MGSGLAGIFAEGAVTAVIATQRGQRNENFFGEGNDSSLPLRAKLGCGGEEIREGSVFCEVQNARAMQNAGFERRAQELTGDATCAWAGRYRRHLGMRSFSPAYPSAPLRPRGPAFC